MKSFLSFLSSLILFCGLFLASANQSPAFADIKSNIKTSGNLNSLADQMTREIIAARGKSKIAIRPFFKDQSRLDPIATERLYQKIYTAFTTQAKQGKIQLIDQRHIMELLLSREEYYMENPEDLLIRAQADVEIICYPQPLLENLRLSCSASDLHNANSYDSREIVIAFDGQTAGAIDYLAALDIMAHNFSENMIDLKSLKLGSFLDLQSGQETETSQMLARNLEASLRTKILERRQALQQSGVNVELRLEEEAPSAPDLPQITDYQLQGDLRQLNKDVVEFYVTVSKDNIPQQAETIRILKKSLPKYLQKPVQNQLVNPVYTAIGKARISSRLNADSARQAALNLARARILAQALNEPAPAFDQIKREADASLVLLHLLKDGFTIEESIVDKSNPENKYQVTIELQAKIRRPGTSVKPVVQGQLNKSSYYSGENIQITLKATGKVNLGIYGWFADGKIVRIYPGQNMNSLVLNKGEYLTLPRQNETALASAPMPYPNNTEDTEALLILASTRQFNFKNLAPYLGDSASDSLFQAIEASDFFDKLGQQDISNLSLHILPYQIRN